MQNETYVQELKATAIRIESIRSEYKTKAQEIVKLIRSKGHMVKNKNKTLLYYVELYEAKLIPTEYFIFQIFQLLYKMNEF